MDKRKDHRYKYIKYKKLYTDLKYKSIGGGPTAVAAAAATKPTGDLSHVVPKLRRYAAEREKRALLERERVHKQVVDRSMAKINELRSSYGALTDQENFLFFMAKDIVELTSIPKPPYDEKYIKLHNFLVIQHISNYHLLLDLKIDYMHAILLALKDREQIPKLYLEIDANIKLDEENEKNIARIRDTKVELSPDLVEEGYSGIEYTIFLFELSEKLYALKSSPDEPVSDQIIQLNLIFAGISSYEIIESFTNYRKLREYYLDVIWDALSKLWYPVDEDEADAGEGVSAVTK
jgi:hypothetical protein